MSISGALGTAFSSLSLTTAQISLSSSNIANADKAGYSTKTYKVDYLNIGSSTALSSAIVIGNIDPTLYKGVISDVSESAYYSVLSEALDTYSSSIGTTSGSNNLSSAYSSLQTALESLETSTDDSNKEAVISAAQSISEQLNALSKNIQDLRSTANQSIANSVSTINEQLNKIKDLNDQIQKMGNLGQSTANLEDDRMTALESLSEQIGVSYFFDTDNNIQILTSGGDTLLDSKVHELSYTSTGYVNDQTLYPTGFDAITLNGKDITTGVSGGKLAANIDLRDNTLVNEQNILDQVAQQLSDTVNQTLSTGTSYPAQTSLTSDGAYSATDAFSATGTLRVAVVDDNGNVNNYSDIDLTTLTSISDLISTLSAVSGISASLDSSGKLVISSSSSSLGVSLGVSSTNVTSTNTNLSDYFGFNDLLSGSSTGTVSASNIHVSSNLKDNSVALAVGTLSDSATLAAGDRGISNGDTTAITNLVNALKDNITFSQTGDMSAQTNTLGKYIALVISHVANKTDATQTKADTASTLYTDTKTAMQNKAGVNIDEETAKTTIYQSQYEAAAQLITTLRDMFSSLLEAVN